MSDYGNRRYDKNTKYDKYDKGERYDRNDKTDKIDKFSAFKSKVKENIRDTRDGTIYQSNINKVSRSPSNNYSKRHRNDSNSIVKHEIISKERKYREEIVRSQEKTSKFNKLNDTIGREKQNKQYNREDYRSSRRNRSRSRSRTHSRGSRKYRKEEYSRRRRSRSRRSGKSNERGFKDNFNSSLVSGFKRKSIFQDASEVQILENNNTGKNEIIKTINENRVVAVGSNPHNKPNDKSDQKLYIGNIPLGIDTQTVSVNIKLIF